MAYGTKYRARFTVLEGPSKTETDYLIYFKKNGFVGTHFDLPYLGGGSVKAKFNNTQDKYIGIHDKTLSIDILSDFNLSELLVANPKDWKIEIEKIEGLSTTLDFSGYLQPSKNSTPHQNGLINYNLEVCDGLTFLKNLDFVDEDAVYYEGLTSVFEVICLCLRKTGTDLKINTINNTYNVDDGISASAEPLKQRYIDLDLFRGESAPLDTYKVLSSILQTEKMRLFQEDGEWWLVYVPELYDGQANSRKYYSSDSSQISYGNLDLRISAIHNSSDYQPMGGGSVSNLPPVKYAKVTHKLGGWKNKLQNKDFREWDGSDFDNWTQDGTSIERAGDGTSGNPYGLKIPGFFTGKSRNADFVFQTVLISSDLPGIEKNIVFSGRAYTQDVEFVYIQCNLYIHTNTYGTAVFGLDDQGEWVRNGADIAISNSDVNKKSKKTPVDWDITSKNISEIIVVGTTGQNVPWKDDLDYVEIQVVLIKGKNQLEPYEGETQDSNVVFKNLSLGWINADTNLNIKEIYYKATQDAYGPNNEELEAVYGDYTDGGNLSAIKNVAGQVTKLWKSATDSTGKNFHTIGAADILQHQSQTQKVYDGTIWGRLKYRHIVSLAGFTNYGYIVSYTYNYGTSFCDVRIVEFQGYISYSQKKTGVLTDGTEINLVEEMLPSPSKGNKPSLPSRFSNTFNWFKQLIAGLSLKNDDDDTIGVVWKNQADGELHDFGSVTRKEGILRVGKDDDTIEVGKTGGTTKVRGEFGLQNENGFLGNYSVAENTDNRTYTFPDDDITVNEWTDLTNVPFATEEDAIEGTSDDTIVSPLVLQIKLDAYIESSISGTENKLAKFGPDGHTIIDSLIEDDGEKVVIGEESTITEVGILSLGGGNTLYRLYDPLTESEGTILNTRYLFMPWGPVIAQGFNINDTFAIGISEDGTKTNFSALNEIHFVRDAFFDENIIIPAAPTLGPHAVNLDYIQSSINGTENRLSKFGEGGHALVDSIISDDGAIVTIDGILSFGGNNRFYRLYDPEIGTDNLILETSSLFLKDGPLIAQGLFINDTFGISVNEGLTNINALNEIHFVVDITFDQNAIIDTAPTLDSHATNKIYVDSHLWEIPSITGLEDALGSLEEEISTKLDADHVNGTANYIPRFTDSDAIGNSVIYQSSGNIGINTISPLYKLDVNGTGRFVNDVTFNANALIATDPTLGVHATNKTYVDGKEWEISSIIGLEEALEGATKGAGSIGHIPRFTDTDILADSIINQVTGNIGIDIALPLYKLDINGTVRVSGEVNFEGNIKIDNDSGLDHQFIKYNGTSNEWSYLNTGELQDKNMIVMYEDIDGERGFRMYSDEDNQFAEAFIFSNPDTGIALALHGYAIDPEGIKEFGLQLDNDGFLYHRKLDGSRKRLATIDMITSAGGGSGVYVPVSPISIVDRVISIATANGSQTGALSSTDWTNFNNKFTLPSGGEDGQVLKKSGDSVVWGDDEVGSGGISLPSGGDDGDMLVKEGSGLAWAEPSGITYEGTLPILVTGSTISIDLAGPEATGALYYGDWIVFNNKVDDGDQLISGLIFLNKTYTSEDPTIATITFKLDTEETINEEDYAIIETDRIREGHSVNSLYIKGIGNMGIAILTEDENLSLTTSNGDLDIMAANGKLYINGFEWDWTGATTGKILSIIDTNKMGWVTP